MPNTLKLISKIISILISSTIALTSCTKKIQDQQEPLVVVSKIKTEDLSKITSVVGQVNAIEQVNLIARVSGFLTKRNFKPGQFVSKGQLLFQIQQDQYIAKVSAAEAKVMEAQADYDFAKIEFNRAKLLLSQNATSQEKLDEATANLYKQEGILKSAKADMELSILNLSYTQILSPFDGRIGMYEYSAGNMVDLSSKTLAVVTQIDPIWVTFNYSEALFETLLQEFNNILPNKSNNSFSLAWDNIRVKLILSNGSEYDKEGRIDFINNLIDPLTGTIQIRALFPNPQEKLIAGGYVQVKLSPYKTTPCLVIPQSALQEDQTGIYTFIVNSQNIVEQKYIKLGMTLGENVTVTSGLNPSDLVITQGILKVRPTIHVNYTIIKDSQNLDLPLSTSPQEIKTSTDTQNTMNN